MPYSHCSMAYSLTEYVLYTAQMWRYTEILFVVHLLVAGFIYIDISVALILKLALFSTSAIHE